ncbi:MAG: (2Fe-2S)-binding protein, partial [Pseudomonadales bacterium]|nr:(2Fe-2S)-binding protein [Pseudomonadales bacterium]
MTDSMSPPPMSYSGYYQTGTLTDDQELTRVGPGTACGEYMRRFWWPVAMVEQVTELPFLIKVLGEDLVLFRDLSGRYG